MRLPFLLPLALVVAGPLVAQQPPADSAASDTVHLIRGDANPLLIGVAAGTLLAAPSVLFLGKPTWDTTGSFPTHDFTAYAASGVIGGASSSSFLHSGNVELIGRHLYGLASAEDFGDNHIQFYTAQAGYFLRPPGGVAGGFALGYRHAAGTRAEDAVLVSFPWVFGGERGTIWLEPTYVISRRGVDWNYRFQGNLYLLPRPFFLGFRFEAKPLYHGGDYRGSVALLVGVHR